MKDERCLKLIDKLEEVSGWKSRKKNEGYGVAITACFTSTVGQVVKVSKNSDGKIKIDQVWVVMDCGWYVNPDIIKAQVEGSVVMALGAATTHEITFKDGMTEQKISIHTKCRELWMRRRSNCILWKMMLMQVVLRTRFASVRSGTHQCNF